MKFSPHSLLLPLFSFYLFLFQTSYSAKILVDAVSKWKSSSVYIGDTVIFKHKNHYNLYIFRTKEAFKLCNLTEATLLSNPNSTTFTWHPSRTGFFYFTFVNGSLKTCHDSQKLAIKVSPSAPPPENSKPELPSEAPPPDKGSSGGNVPSSGTFPWPSRPRQVVSPTQAPVESSPVTMTDKGGAMPFINSNPAVPLPTGEVDSATLRPFLTSAHGRQVTVENHMALMIFGVLTLLMMN